MLYFGLLLFAFLTFAQPQLYVPLIKGKPVVALVMGSVGAVWALRTMGGEKTNFSRAPQNVFMVLMWAVVTASTLGTAWLGYSKEIFNEWGKTVVIYFLFISIVTTLRQVRALLWVIVLSMGVTGFLSILQLYGIDYAGLGAMLEGRVRGLGIFGTNQLAYGLCFCTPLAFGLFITTRRVTSRLGLAVVFAVYLYALFITQSRGGFLCMTAVVVMLFLLFDKGRWAKIAGIIAGVLCFGALMKFAPRFSSSLDYQSDASALGRLGAWSGGLVELKNHPFLGIGKGQFVDTFGIAPHNSYIEAVTELGIAGLFLWLGLFYFSFKYLRRSGIDDTAADARLTKVFARSLQASLGAYLVGSCFSSSAYYIPLYMLIALAVILQRRSPAARTMQCTLRDLFIIGGIEGAVLLCIHWMV
jgi:O-antigen ligase